jgi:hypothetical protein
VPRGGVIALIVLGFITLFMVWGVPYLKNVFTNQSKFVNVEITFAEDDFDVDFKGASVSRTVVGMVVEFPMGRAPDGPADLRVKDGNGKELEVTWSMPEKQTDEDKQIDRWTFREVYFPIGFREGMLCNRYNDLKWFHLANVTTKSVAQ